MIIYQGDDSSAFGQKITFRLRPGSDYAGRPGIVSYGEKKTPAGDITIATQQVMVEEDNTFSLTISESETHLLALGVHPVRIKVFDESGKGVTLQQEWQLIVEKAVCTGTVIDNIGIVVQ